MPRSGKRGKYKLRPLSDKQVTMFKFILEYIDKHEFPPSIREIGDAAGIPSTSVVNYNLNKLVEHRLISRWKEVSRAIKINRQRASDMGFAVDPPRVPPLKKVPILGNVVASNPVNVGELNTWNDAREWIDVSPSLLGDVENPYALRVQGDSMINANILDNDVVLMGPAHEVRNGDLVGAWLQDDDEMTLKRYFREGDMVRLQPSSPNPEYQPIVRPTSQVSIQGKVLAIVRTMV